MRARERFSPRDWGRIPEAGVELPRRTVPQACCGGYVTRLRLKAGGFSLVVRTLSIIAWRLRPATRPVLINRGRSAAANPCPVWSALRTQDGRQAKSENLHINGLKTVAMPFPVRRFRASQGRRRSRQRARRGQGGKSRGGTRGV